MALVFDPDIQRDLWKHMFKKCLVRLGTAAEFSNRKKLLSDLEQELDAGSYVTRPVVGFLSAHKGSGVARFIPVLHYLDVAVYFACVKAFDEKLAALAVEDTFGGWSLGGKRREVERE